MAMILAARFSTKRLCLNATRPLARPLTRSFHTKSGPEKKDADDRKKFSFRRMFTGQEHKFNNFYEEEIAKNPLYAKMDQNLTRSLSKESFYEGMVSGKAGGQGGQLIFRPIFGVLLTLVVVSGICYYGVTQLFEKGLKGAEGMGSEEQEYLVESSEKSFKDVKGMDEILSEFEQVVDLLTQGEKYKQIGAKVPKGILLNGKPGTGKTLIAKAIAGEAGVPFLYAAGSQFDEMYVGVGAKRIRKLFEEARENAPCIIFIDEIDAVGGKRKTGGNTSDYSRMTINQLLQEMDGFKTNDDIIVIGATNLKAVLDPALLRPGRFDLVIDVPTPNKKGRKEILQHYFEKVKHNSSINVERLASITGGLNGSQLENIVNQAAIRAVRQRHEQVDTSHLEYAFDKITMGPELVSMDQSPDGMRKTAIHEGGHCLAAYLLNKAGEYDSKPRKATITRRGGALGHVSFQQDEKTDEESQSLQSLRSHLVVGMAGRAAEAIFFGEEKVHTGAMSDMQGALRIAKSIVCHSSAHANQIKGRMIDTQDSSEKKKEHVDDLIDHEIDFAYKRATQLLNDNAKLHHLLIDAMMKFKTLDLDEIELLMKTKSLRDIEKRRTEVEKSRSKAKTPTIKEGTE